MVTQTQATLPQETLPPSARDFEVYRLIKVERQSTRAVAKLLHLSQTRVCQVVVRVAEYLVDTTQPEDEARREQQLAIARQVASEQIDYCIKRALSSFESSCCEVKVAREVIDPSGRVTNTSTKRQAFGETRYLTTIARLAAIKSKLPICSLPIAVRRTADEIAADVEEGAGDVEESTVGMPPKMSPFGAAAIAEEPSIPSKGACSPKPSEQPFPPLTLAELEFVNREIAMLYNDELRAMNGQERQLSETVHPGKSSATVEQRRPTELERKRLRRDRRKQRSASMA